MKYLIALLLACCLGTLLANTFTLGAQGVKVEKASCKVGRALL